MKKQKKKGAKKMKIYKKNRIIVLLLTFLFTLPCLQAIAGVGSEDPANAFPANTLFFAEVSDPDRVYDTIRRMPFWPGLEQWMQELVDPNFHLDDQFIRHLSAAAGSSFVVGLIPEPVIALRSGGNMLRSDSVTWLTNRLTADDNSCKVCDAGAWQVICPGEVTKRVYGVATALAHRTHYPGGSLASLDDYQSAFHRLPDASDARAFINIDVVKQGIPNCDLLSDTGKQVLTSCLSWSHGIGIARKITAESIHTWIAGRIVEEELDKVMPGLMDSVTEIRKPNMEMLPAHVLASYEVAMPFDALLRCLGSVLQSVAPTLHDRIAEGLLALDPEGRLDRVSGGAHLFGPTTVFTWLPVSDAAPKWPFPRATILIPLNDAEEADRIMADITDWVVSALAPWSEGVLGARRIDETHEGIKVTGLEINSLLSFPMPSPAYARMGDWLIVSPVRSAVKEMISSLQGGAETLAQSKPLPNKAAEHFYWNPEAWADGIESDWELCVTGCSLFMLKTRYLFEVQKEIEKLRRMGEVFCNVLKHFGPSEGHTLYDDDGGYIFYMELPIVAE